jgi:DNA-binding NarL/FixJ family response regulator
VLRIAVVDDHPVARHGMASILAPVPDLDVVASVATVAELPRDAQGRPEADLVLLDLYLSDGKPALPAISELSEHVAVLVVSASRAPADVLAAMQAGASGYLTKHADEEAYRTAIAAIAAGGFHFSAQLADLVHAAAQEQPVRPAREQLSPREQEALAYIARGFTHQQTATRMHVSKATVDTYIARIRTKLNLGNKAELALAALRHLNSGPGGDGQPSGR